MAETRKHRFQFVAWSGDHLCSACGWPDRFSTPEECPGVPTPLPEALLRVKATLLDAPEFLGARPKPTLVELPKRDPTPTKERALEAVDGLRRKIESGEVVAFVAVGIMDDDTIEGFVGSSKPVTRLRMHGAIAALGHDVLDGKL